MNCLLIKIYDLSSLAVCNHLKTYSQEKSSDTYQRENDIIFLGVKKATDDPIEAQIDQNFFERQKSITLLWFVFQQVDER